MYMGSADHTDGAQAPSLSGAAVLCAITTYQFLGTMLYSTVLSCCDFCLRLAYPGYSILG